MRLYDLKSIIVVFIFFSLFLPSSSFTQSLNQKLNIAKQLENHGRFQNAQEFLEEIYQNHPDNVVVFLRYSNILMKTQSYGTLLTLIDEKEKQGDINPDYTLLKARVFYRQGKYTQAMQIWNSILQKFSQNRTMYYKVASSMINERLLEEALQVYLLGRKKINNEDLFTLNIVNIYEALLHFKEATEELTQYLNNHPKSYNTVEAKLYRFKGSDQIITTVSTCIKKAIKKQPENTVLKELLIKYFIETECFQEGWNTAQRFFPTNKQKNENILFMFAEKAYEAGSPVMAEKAYKKILKADTIFIPVEKVYYGLAQTMEAQDNNKQAVEYYNLIYVNQRKSPYAVQAMLKKARILKDELNEFNNAEVLYRSLINQSLNPQQHYTSRFSLGECLIAQGKIEKAEKIYLEAAEEYTTHRNKFWIKAIVALGRIFYLNGKFDKSIEYLGKLSTQDIDEKYLSEESLNDGLELRMLIKQNLKDSPKPLRLLARAEYYEEQREYTKAIAFLDSIFSDYTESNIVQYGLLKKGSILIKLKQFKQSIKTFENFLAQYPSDKLTDRALERIGWVYQKEGKTKLAVKYYENLLINFPASLLKEEVRLRIRSIEEKAK